MCVNHYVKFGVEFFSVVSSVCLCLHFYTSPWYQMFMPLSQGEERREGIWLWLHSTDLQLILATHGGYPWEEQALNIPSQRKTVAQVGLKLSVWLRRTLNFWIFYLCFPLAGITSMYHPSSASGIRASSQGSVGAREALYQLSATSDLQSTLITTVVSENPLRYPVLTPVSDVPQVFLWTSCPYSDGHRVSFQFCSLLWALSYLCSFYVHIVRFI